MSDWLGSENFSGSDSTSAARHSFGNANPIVQPSREIARYTIRPIRNFTWPRTNPSVVRGSASATARISSVVTTALVRRIRPDPGLLLAFLPLGPGQRVLDVPFLLAFDLVRPV